MRCTTLHYTRHGRVDRDTYTAILCTPRNMRLHAVTGSYQQTCRCKTGSLGLVSGSGGHVDHDSMTQVHLLYMYMRPYKIWFVINENAARCCNFAIKGQILYGFKQGHGQGFAISRNSLICEFVISGVDCTVYVFIVVLKRSHRILVRSLARNSARLCGQLVCTNEHRTPHSVHMAVHVDWGVVSIESDMDVRAVSLIQARERPKAEGRGPLEGRNQRYLP